ncbi:MAG: radical SAM protein [Syntrophotaleaceae bacterium]
MSLTISPSFRCNSSCRTCNVYKKDSAEISVEEWKKVFLSLGKSPFWITISGGEPFLNDKLGDIACLFYNICRPSIINIPTNGLLVSKIPDVVRRIGTHCCDSAVVVNVSIDALGPFNDDIRGVHGSYDKAIESILALKSLQLPNLSVGIHTVISRFNVEEIPSIYKTLRALNADSYITEIAEERVELDTIGACISPDSDLYFEAADFLVNQLQKEHFSRLGKITRIFRIEYYHLIKRILRERRQVIPCYAGFASAQIAPDGDVWGCCIRAESMGNLKNVNFDFKKIWFGERAEQIRGSIKAGECHCPLANAAYTNMLHDPRSLLRVLSNLVGGR